MSSKQEILRAIRQSSIPMAELPSLAGEWIKYADGPAKFQEMVQFVGGRCLRVASLEEAQADLSAYPPYLESKRVFSLIEGLGSNSVEMSSIEEPHALEDLDFAILPGEFAVAENGAIWVTDQQLRHRVAYFITQHLSLVVYRDQLLDNMYEAYQRLSFEKPQFGVFISGPSKTADIEQSLVIGAHGARSLTVYLVEKRPNLTVSTA